MGWTSKDTGQPQACRGVGGPSLLWVSWCSVERQADCESGTATRMHAHSSPGTSGRAQPVPAPHTQHLQLPVPALRRTPAGLGCPPFPEQRPQERGLRHAGQGRYLGWGKCLERQGDGLRAKGVGALGPGALPALPQAACFGGCAGSLWSKDSVGNLPLGHWGWGGGCLLSCCGGLPSGPLRPAPPRPGPHAGPGKAGGVQSHSGRLGLERAGLEGPVGTQVPTRHRHRERLTPAPPLQAP